MIKDYFKLAIENITHRKLRSWLTIIGIVIGIAIVVALVSLGQGVKKVITDEFSKMGSDKIFVFPTTMYSGGGEDFKAMTDHDIEVIRRTKGVSEAAGMVFQAGRIEYNREVYYNFVFGIPMDDSIKLLEEAMNYEMAAGRTIKSGDKYKAVIGNDISTEKTFGRNVKVGETLIIDGYKFEVVGIIAKIGDPDMDNGIMIPEETAREVFNLKRDNGYETSEIIVRVESGEDPAVVAENIKRELRRSRNVKEGYEDFEVQTTEQLLESFGVILNALSAIVIGIAAISLFVGGVGIMNTMYTAVLQRTNEIGVMKAIGAKNSDILQIFLIESGMLGLAGGAIGLVIGIGLSELIALIGRTALDTIMLQAYFPWYLVVGALGFAFVIGMISGALPALQASRQNPVESLRYE